MPKSNQPIVTKLLRLPADWMPAIEKARGDQPFSEFVREAVLAMLPARERKQLTPNPKHGQRSDLQ